MASLLVELYDRHVLEKNVYQAFISDCDEILFLSLTKISNEEKLSLRQFIMEEVPHIQRVTFRQLSLEQLADQLDYCLAGYNQVLLDVFGGDSLLALSLYQYGLDRHLPIVAMDVERGKQYKWVAGQLEKKRFGHSNPQHPTVDSLAWWKNAQIKTPYPLSSANYSH